MARFARSKKSGFQRQETLPRGNFTQQDIGQAWQPMHIGAAQHRADPGFVPGLPALGAQFVEVDYFLGDVAAPVGFPDKGRTRRGQNDQQARCQNNRRVDRQNDQSQQARHQRQSAQYSRPEGSYGRWGAGFVSKRVHTDSPTEVFWFCLERPGRSKTYHSPPREELSAHTRVNARNSSTRILLPSPGIRSGAGARSFTARTRVPSRRPSRRFPLADPRIPSSRR